MGEREAATDGEQVAPCMCPTCVQSRALSVISDALLDIEVAREVAIDYDTEVEMAYHHLREQVAYALEHLRMSRKAKAWLEQAFRDSRPPRSGPGGSFGTQRRLWLCSCR